MKVRVLRAALAFLDDELDVCVYDVHEFVKAENGAAIPRTEVDMVTVSVDAPACILLTVSS